MNLIKQKVTAQQAGVKRSELIPDFLIIGAGKSGTTSLDCYLKQHPEIFIPKVKEPNFYGYENSKIEDFINDPIELKHFKGSVTNLRDYLALFKNAKEHQVRGETSNTYMYHRQAAERIKYYNPDMKLIAVLRQPALRLYSRYLHLLRDQRTNELGSDFSACLDHNSIWWKRNDLVREGFYFQHLSAFYRLFPKRNIKVYLYEELNDHPQRTLKDIYEFLGVNTEFSADVSIRFNKSGIVKNQLLDMIIGQNGIVALTARTLLPTPVYSIVKNNTTLLKVVNALRDTNLERPKLDKEIRHRLTHRVYGTDIKNLQHLIDKDLSHWLRF